VTGVWRLYTCSGGRNPPAHDLGDAPVARAQPGSRRRHPRCRLMALTATVFNHHTSSRGAGARGSARPSPPSRIPSVAGDTAGRPIRPAEHPCAASRRMAVFCTTATLCRRLPYWVDVGGKPGSSAATFIQTQPLRAPVGSRTAATLTSPISGSFKDVLHPEGETHPTS